MQQNCTYSAIIPALKPPIEGLVVVELKAPGSSCGGHEVNEVVTERPVNAGAGQKTESGGVSPVPVP
jgi:hypothetical protein